ncbi:MULTISPECIES: adenylate/guanylate cyclase domain-containing protein [unclassified Mesorhizobium]|uniref:adenylate/guanylate cyclase domain-containing protein n=1 Tax=unclassified Mesorhizobium TaxID=325217 RepID=UPI000FCAB5C0|nr:MULTISPECIES: adenylate/guanylate cyclase domain-containing protein [unclassified Mesorhizobium]TIT76222.1 MAG: adenylate/guanylate cyclase domain-containing protein [Mesorhizobium sp.]TGP22440.1 adenylate/guanylate cyclase domain-containing protein [Mesorhizobium sp. M1D.F.Ca.ET.231.01.1.1]TGP26008.1 adenylate/guanylate cyclase domain-containing protein [Mesorhizobium sp. M1D.F.Ca.ET.234.01.1.1]TGS40076.1 adenylate/guanylate cyclase domain-containing protein [Mesorhizobium sp. M1D.F.Ca.ET.1
MSAAHAEISTILMDKVADWLNQSALAGHDLETLIKGFCERLAAAGLPLKRVHLSFSMLHPLYDALGFTWFRGEGLEVESFRSKPGVPSDRFLTSPYYHLLSNKLDHLRRRLDPSMPSEFPVFDDLRLMGVTDYMAFVLPFSGNTSQGMMGSWSTDSAGGFSDSMISALLRIQSHLAIATKMAVLTKLADNMMTTYLGGDAGKRVLDGQIKRGEGDTIRAALVMGDMRGSSKLAETSGREIYIDTLNQFFDAVAAPFNRKGGQIMSFIGDGFIAVYPCERHRSQSEIACQAALAAAHKATARMTDLNLRRKEKGLSDIKFGLGLHVGNVMFGNVGLTDRLTFSVFGSAVNEVQRLQTLTKKYPHSVLASKDFASYCGANSWLTLGNEELVGIKQKLTVLSPDLSGALALDEDGALEPIHGRMSDAEQVMLLHRDAARISAGDPSKIQ